MLMLMGLYGVLLYVFIIIVAVIKVYIIHRLITLFNHINRTRR